MRQHAKSAAGLRASKLAQMAGSIVPRRKITVNNGFGAQAGQPTPGDRVVCKYGFKASGTTRDDTKDTGSQVVTIVCPRETQLAKSDQFELFDSALASLGVFEVEVAFPLTGIDREKIFTGVRPGNP